MSVVVVCPGCSESVSLEDNADLRVAVCPRCRAKLSSHTGPADSADSTLKDGKARFDPRSSHLAEFLASIGGERYEIEQEVGRGAMGIVYRAHDRNLNRTVAIKVLPEGQLAAKHKLLRFQREAESAANVAHPNIVPVHDVVLSERFPYFTMRYVSGENLAKVLERGPLAVQEALKMIVKVSRAVGAAHNEGIIHRDIKPSNIIIDRNSEPHVTDFGLAKDLKEVAELTEDGHVLGTAAYMSSEQAAGRSSQVDARSDIFALGATLYHMLTGEAPCSSSLLARMSAQDDVTPPRERNTTISAQLNALVLKALAEDPGDRYQSVESMVADLEKLPDWTRDRPTPSRSGRLTLALAILCATAALASLLLWHLNVLSRLREATRQVQSAASEQRVSGLLALKQIGGAKSARLALPLVDPANAPGDADVESEAEANVRRAALDVVLHTASAKDATQRTALLHLAMADPSFAVREAAARHVEAGAFEAVPPRERLLVLLRGLPAFPDAVRREIGRVAADVLAKERIPLDLSLCDEVAQSPAQARLWLIRATADRKPDGAVAILHRLIEGQPETVSTAAVAALAAFSPRNQVSLFARLARQDDSLQVRLAAIGGLAAARTTEGQRELIRLLTPATAARDGSTRAGAARALADYDSAEAVAALTAALGDAHLTAREAAAWALGRQRAGAAVGALARLLAPQHERIANVRRAAAEALGRIGGPEAAAALRAALQAERAELVVKQIIEALGETSDPRAVPSLVAILRDGESRHPHIAADALLRIGASSRDVVEALAERIRTSQHGMNEVTYRLALQKLLKKDQFPTLIGMLRPRDRRFQGEVYRLLSRGSARRALGALIEHGLTTESPEVRAASIEILERQTGQRFGYDGSAGAAERDKAVEHWRAWLRVGQTKRVP